ncbi:unnamed protein product [Linum tenue]|uniref:Uncharacterized protein n=1 Tax=Linum tenue TaxID=586396 RepID=A0AAV0I7C9_9ROSI|nr:unnamed protein product [Linum tenue]
MSRGIYKFESVIIQLQEEFLTISTDSTIEKFLAFCLNKTESDEVPIEVHLFVSQNQFQGRIQRM